MLAAAKPIGIEVLVAGAFARDLHAHYEYGLDVERRTEDIDFALAVDSWPRFEALRDALLRTDEFDAVQNRLHRLQHRDGLPVDLVPFGGVENGNRHLAWPPTGDVVMHVLGFREALKDAQTVLLPGNVAVNFASLPALVLLKLVAWQDRHRDAPRRDAPDLWLLLRNYTDMGNAERLYSEFPHWMEDPDFDYQRAGAYIAGADIAALLEAQSRKFLVDMIAREADPDIPGLLPAEMNRHDPERARRLLAALHVGLKDD